MPMIGRGGTGRLSAHVRNGAGQLLDEFAFYDYALSAAQVAAHYNAGKGKYAVGGL